MSTSIDDISSYLNTTGSSTKIDTGETMNYEDFLTLLSAELQNQDPTNPMDNKDMVLQLAQFSTLSTLADLNTNMESFISTSTISTVNGFIGKQLSYSQTDEDDNTTTGSGTCTAVNIADDGTITLTVGGTAVKTAEVTSITNASTTTTTTE
jgi:flagellar basal-body rod modification protein FlgD